MRCAFLFLPCFAAACGQADPSTLPPPVILPDVALGLTFGGLPCDQIEGMVSFAVRGTTQQETRGGELSCPGTPRLVLEALPPDIYELTASVRDPSGDTTYHVDKESFTTSNLEGLFHFVEIDVPRTFGQIAVRWRLPPNETCGRSDTVLILMNGPSTNWSYGPATEATGGDCAVEGANEPAVSVPWGQWQLHATGYAWPSDNGVTYDPADRIIELDGTASVELRPGRTETVHMELRRVAQ